jgi:hypothetical protein
MAIASSTPKLDFLKLVTVTFNLTPTLSAGGEGASFVVKETVVMTYRKTNPATYPLAATQTRFPSLPTERGEG